jgi:hypothetical protein
MRATREPRITCVGPSAAVIDIMVKVTAVSDALDQRVARWLYRDSRARRESYQRWRKS